MACETPLLFESFITLVALEWSLPSVPSHVFLQITRSSASIVALVTFERLFSCVHGHYVNFQSASSDARIRAPRASLWLFTRVRFLVSLQVACYCCFVFTLIAIVQFPPSVRIDVPFEVGRIVKRKVALIAFV